MKRTRILLAGLAIVSIFLLFKLPKVVVDNDEPVVDEGPAQSTIAATRPIDSLTLSAISALTENLEEAENSRKNTIFADSLANLYIGLVRWDSAAKYVEIVAKAEPTSNNLLRAGEAYFEAQSSEADPAKAEEYGEIARSYFEQLRSSADSLEVQVRIGLTHVSSSNPMQGILMIRQVLEEDPNHELALYTLGVLSMQSGQFQRAVERFEQLIAANPDNLSVYFHLGVSYMEIGNKEKAKEQFEFVKNNSEDPEVQANAEAYLQEIN